MDILALAFIFFIVANPIGNSPTIVALLKDYSFERQQKIMLRESIFSLLIALFFQFFGEIFLNALHINRYSLTLTGGLVLFLTALQVIFHKPEFVQGPKVKQEPFFVPIAIPLISGPGLMTVIMTNAAIVQNHLQIAFSILLAWVGVTGVLVIAPLLQRILGKNGMSALEQVMGMILGLISMNMIVDALRQFIQTL